MLDRKIILVLCSNARQQGKLGTAIETIAAKLHGCPKCDEVESIMNIPVHVVCCTPSLGAIFLD
jgi:hypothetical protein